MTVIKLIFFVCRPLHLAVIHEKIDLIRYIIRLVKGVDTHANLDIPNNMRQVGVSVTCTC